MARTAKTGKTPRPPGRPAVANPRHRPVSVMVSDVELACLRKLAAKRGVSVSSLIREEAFAALGIRR